MKLIIHDLNEDQLNLVKANTINLNGTVGFIRFAEIGQLMKAAVL